MNVSSISSVESVSKDSKAKLNNQKNQPSFKGIGDSLVNFWQFVDNGGRALQFTVEDMCGTNLPRTYKGAVAGYKYTHKINVPALLQEGVREFLTGPTMCIMPILILNIANKLTGKTANTHTENIRNLTYLMGKQIENTGSYDEKEFISTVVDDMLLRSTGQKVDENSVKEMTDKIVSYKELTSSAADSKAKKEAQELLGELESSFQKIVKSKVNNYKDVDFLSAKYTVSASGDSVKQGATKFKNYVSYIAEYARDYEKQAAKHGGIVNLDAFKTTWLGRRVLTFVSMFAITGAMMCLIPKIYTKVSGSINPNATAIYDEAKKPKGSEEPKDKEVQK